ncbi:MAG TPA: hypothetical protein VGM05_19115 [Planctomycetaceae bacterium]|jgi:hypothetical protein
MHDPEFDDPLQAELQRQHETCSPLEERLADEAQRMLAGAPQRPPVARLRAEFVSRRRQRMLAQALCATAAMIAVGLTVTNLKPRPARDIAQVVTNGGGDPTPEAEARQGIPSDTLGQDISRMTAKPDSVPGGAIAILIPQTGSDGEQNFVSAWFVPGQVEEIDARNLSPAERSAVSQLLGPDYELSPDETI